MLHVSIIAKLGTVLNYDKKNGAFYHVYIIAWYSLI